MTSPWAAPEAPADASGPVARRRPPGVARLAPAVTQPVPVPLRPLTMGEILDGGFETIRIAPSLILGLAALVVIPTELLLTWLDRDLLDGNGWRYVLSRPWRYLVDSGTETGDPRALAVWLVFIFGLLVPALCAVGIGRVLSAWYAGTPISHRAAASAMATRSWVVVMLAPVRAMGTLLLGIPLVLLMLTGPAVGIEGVRPGQAFSRSWNLTQPRFWTALGFYTLSAFLFFLVTATLNLVFFLFAELFLGEVGWVLMVGANIAIAVVLNAFLAAATCLLYLDSRVRIEGLDLDLALIDHWSDGGR